MKKKILILLVALMVLWSLSACTYIEELVSSYSANLDDEYAYEETAARISEETTYYNSYLGVSYTIPSGWWLYEVYEENFNQMPSTTTDPTVLDIYRGSNYLYMDMLSYASLQYSTKDNHLGFDISAEKVEGVSNLAEYMPVFEEFMLEPTSEADYVLLAASQMEIAGQTFERRTFEVQRPEAPYKIMSLTCAVNDGYYLTILGNYWPKYTDAEEKIIEVVNAGLKFL